MTDIRPPKGTIVGGLDISRTYPIDEIIRLYHSGRLSKVGIEGYIVRADSDGMVGFVKADEGSLSRLMTGKPRVYASDDFVPQMREDIEREHPMVRRSAQERKLALVKRLLSTAKKHGTVPGLSDAQITALIGEKWVTGTSVVTQQMLDRIAQRFMEQGEQLNKEADAGRVTKAHPLAHSAT